MVWSDVPQPLAKRPAAELLELVGEDGLIAEPSRLLAYESDGLVAYRFPPRAVVLPIDTAQAADVVGILHRHAIPSFREAPAQGCLEALSPRAKRF